jgi:hypothetical protein
MQNWIIRYVEDIYAVTSETGCSIAQALERILPEMQASYIQKIREGAADLERILVLELQRRDEAAECGTEATWKAIARGDLHAVAGLTMKRKGA